MQLKFELWLILHMLFVYIASNYLVWLKNPTSKRNSENSPGVGTLTTPTPQRNVQSYHAF